MTKLQHPTQIVDALRAQLGNLEGRELELRGERDELAYAASVDREPRAIKRLAAIKTELADIAHETATIGAALRDAVKRERAAEEAERVSKRIQNAAAAEALVADVERLGVEIDTGLRALVEHSAQLRDRLSEIRKLIGVGPTHEALRVHLGRVLNSSLMGTSLHIAHLAPADRATATEITSRWSDSIRGGLTALTAKPAKAA
jgi:hypothetical protein